LSHASLSILKRNETTREVSVLGLGIFTKNFVSIANEIPQIVRMHAMCVCVCVCVYVCMHVCVYVRMYVRLYPVLYPENGGKI